MRGLKATGLSRQISRQCISYAILDCANCCCGLLCLKTRRGPGNSSDRTIGGESADFGPGEQILCNFYVFGDIARNRVKFKGFSRESVKICTVTEKTRFGEEICTVTERF